MYSLIKNIEWFPASSINNIRTSQLRAKSTVYFKCLMDTYEQLNKWDKHIERA